MQIFNEKFNTIIPVCCILYKYSWTFKKQSGFKQYSSIKIF